MTPTIETIEADALQLTVAERADLVERLIASLAANPEIEEAWALEAQRRQEELDSGAVSLISGPECLAELKAELG